MSITQGIVDICLQYAKGRRIKNVVIQIGQISGVVPEAVEFCFAACSVETAAEGAVLEIQQPPGMGRCIECALIQPLERLYDPCRECGSYALEIIGGEEIRVLEIEIDD